MAVRVSFGRLIPVALAAASMGVSIAAAMPTMAVHVSTGSAQPPAPEGQTLEKPQRQVDPLDRAREHLAAGDHESAFHELQNISFGDHLDAMVLMGQVYHHKSRDTADRSYGNRAFAYWLVAADQGSINGAFRTGVAYNFGIGIPQDFLQARYWYEKAVQADHVGALRNLARMYEGGRADDAGQVQRDDERALGLYLRAAELGDTLSMVGAAKMYADGRGTVRDFQRAMEQYEHAAVLGEPSAMRALGDAYEKGRMVARDLVISYMWYSVAGRTYSHNISNPFSSELSRRLLDVLNHLEVEMDPEDIRAAQRMAREWLEQHQDRTKQ